MHKEFEKKLTITMLLGLLTLLPSLVFASVAGEVNKANDLYKQSKYNDSIDLYQKALDQDDQSPVVKYDLGTALYKKGDYEKALGYLEQAAEGKNINIKPKAEYNLGNVLYKSGIQKENTNVDQAIRSLKEALGHYEQTIGVDPKDQDAKYNEDFVKKEIERLKQKKQEQQQQKQQQKDQRQQQDQKKEQKNQQGQQAQQGQQNQQDQQKSQDGQKEKQGSSNDQKDRKSQEPRKQQQGTKVEADQSQKELDRKAAQDLLEDYQENEEPKKLINYMPKKIDDRPVLKDW